MLRSAKTFTPSVLLTAALLLGCSTAAPPAVTPDAAAQDSGIPAVKPVADLNAHRDRAVEVVRQASQSEDALLRTLALEAVQYAPDLALPLVTLGLTDESPAVRFSALYAAGKLRLVALTGMFQDAYLQDKEDPMYDHVRAAIIFAAKRCGVADDRIMSVMAGLLMHPDPRVRANAAMLTGELGNDSAIPLLRQCVHKPRASKIGGIHWQLLSIQVAEALAKLGDANGLAELRRSSYSNFDEIRILSVQALGRLGDDAFWSNMNNFLVENPVEFRLAAAEGLARLGRDRGGMLTVMAEASTHELATVRAQSAFALGPYDNDLARGYLVRLLKDADPKVRISAAAAILQATAE
ncbi:MAG: HEAT repeat domain-containing protein [Planctomycetota bacterium]